MYGSKHTFALQMIARFNTIEHKKKFIKKFDTRPNYIPVSARFKFILTCCDQLKNDTNFQANSDGVNRGIESLQLLIGEETKNVVERELHVMNFVCRRRL